MATGFGWFLAIIFKVVFWGYVSTVGISTGLTLIKNAYTNGKLYEQGYDIKGPFSMGFKQFFSYYKDNYGKLFSPFKNIWWSLKRACRSSKKFIPERMSALSEVGRIEEAKKAPAIKMPVIPDYVPVEERTEEPERAPEPERIVVPSMATTATPASTPEEEAAEKMSGKRVATPRENRDLDRVMLPRELMTPAQFALYKMKMSKENYKAALARWNALTDVSAKNKQTDLMNLYIEDYKAALRQFNRESEISRLEAERTMLAPGETLGLR